MKSFLAAHKACPTSSAQLLIVCLHDLCVNARWSVILLVTGLPFVATVLSTSILLTQWAQQFLQDYM